MCEPCNVLQSGSRFDFLQPFLSFWNLCKSSSRPCFPVPYGPMQRLCHPAHFFSFVVSQNSFNSIKLQISNPRFPLLLFTLSNTPTQNYTTVLLISQDTLQSLVVQDVQPTWPKVRKGNPPGSTTPNPSCSQTTKESAMPNVGK